MLRNLESLLDSFLVFPLTLFLLTACALGQSGSVLYSFTGSTAGYGPVGNLVFDATGNLYGTTLQGGTAGGGGDGVVYELSPATGGGWTETVLHAFSGGSDGRAPVAGLVFDAAGNLYGTTESDGTYSRGTVFELSPASGGGWKEKVIYSFSGGVDGATPTSALVIDAAGNLYGTTIFGGIHSLGTVFELSPNAEGGWDERVILAGDQAHGGGLNGSVAFDSSGNLYVTAATGGTQNAGAIYRLRFASGAWTGAVIYTFQGGVDGGSPSSGLTWRAPNRLFGITNEGGSFGYGTAFELTPSARGSWNKAIMHNFGGASDGLPPINSLTLGTSGQLYGTTQLGGGLGGGTAFELMETSGVWKERVLHNFTNRADAGNPDGGVVLDSSGNLYGEGYYGGASGLGAVYEIRP